MCASRFLLEPMKLCASSLGQCFRLFFKEVPLQWQPVLFITGVCLVVLFILTHAGLEIWTPLLRLGFKKRDNVEALENENRRLLAENQTMRREIDQRPHIAIEEVGEHALGEPQNGYLFHPRGGNYATPVISPPPEQPIEEVGERAVNIVSQMSPSPPQRPVDIDVGEPLNDPIAAGGEDGPFREPVQEESVSIVNAMELTSPTTNIPTVNTLSEAVPTPSGVTTETNQVNERRTTPSGAARESSTASSNAASDTALAPSNSGNEAIIGYGGEINISRNAVGENAVLRNSISLDSENGDDDGAVGFEIVDRIDHSQEDLSIGAVPNNGNGDDDETANGEVRSGVTVTRITERRAVEHSENQL